MPARPPGKVVAVRQGAVLATAFHPELTGDLRMHALFCEVVRATAAASGVTHTAVPRPPAEPDRRRVAGSHARLGDRCYSAGDDVPRICAARE